METVARKQNDARKFTPEEGVSYSAGVAYLHKPAHGAPEILLVLQSAGEKNPQKSGGFFVEKRSWKMPMGHFDPKKDNDFIDTAVREFGEETGFSLGRGDIKPSLAVPMRIPSERPGAAFHEDIFFLVISPERFKAGKEKAREENIEAADFFPIDQLPNGVNERSRGAEIAWGHQKKLARILLSLKGKLPENFLKI